CGSWRRAAESASTAPASATGPSSPYRLRSQTKSRRRWPMSQPEYSLEDYKSAIGSLQVDSPKMTRLKAFKRRYGGEIHYAGDAAGHSLYAATVNGERVSIGIGEDGEAFTFTIGKGRRPLPEP